MTNRYTFNHLKLVTSVFGAYLFLHFYYLMFYAQELFSNNGMLPAELSPAYGYFPNILNLATQSYLATVLVVVMTVLSLFVIAGTEKKLIYLVLWFGWACLLCRNPLIRNPGLPYVGWMLLAFAVIYPIKDRAQFRLDKYIFVGAWSLLAVGYSLSGLDKMQAISWQNGTTISHLLDNPLARDYFPTYFLLKHKWLHPIMSYMSLGFEVLFLPLALFKRTRPFIWLALVGMQLGILFVVDFADLTFGMMMIHLFTFDPNWIPNKIKKDAIVFFDGVCGLCNKSIDFLMVEDSNQNLKYSPLQGETIKKYSSQKISDENMQTLYVWTGTEMLEKSKAWLWLMSQLGGLWFLLALPLKLVPLKLMDALYALVAENRYKIFGKKETCRLPTPSERALFLD